MTSSRIGEAVAQIAPWSGMTGVSRVFAGAVVVAVAGGALAYAAGVPAFSSADEAAHVDYAFQLWHGQLPVFEKGLVLPTDVGHRPAVQWVAQHPPLFYSLIAPVVGPLGDAHRPVAAALAARLITMLIAMATAFAAVWAARQIVPRRYSGASFAAPIIMVCSPWLLRLGGAVYNDILQILVVTVMLGLTAKMIRQGAGRYDILWLSLTFACGGLTRLSFVPLALACLLALAVAQLIRDRRDVGALVRIVVIPSVIAVAASGWFYLRNIELTGSVAGSHPEWAAEHLGRVHYALSDVLTSSTFWVQSLRQFMFSPEFGERANYLLFVAPALIALVIAAVFVVRGMRARVPWASSADVVILGLVVLCVGGVFLQQALYVTKGGGANGRYFTMLILLFSIAIAVTLTSMKQLGPWLLAGWLVVHAVDLYYDLRLLFARVFKVPTADAYLTLAWSGFGLHLAALVVALGCYVVWNRRGPEDRDANLTGVPALRGAVR